MIWVVSIFANGTVLLLLNATIGGGVANITLPAPLGSAPYVAVDGVAVPAILQNQQLAVPLGGGGVVTVKYVPKLGEADGFLYFNLTTPDLFVVWAQAGVLVMPHLKIINFTYVDRDLLIVARGPGALAYTKPRPPTTTTTQQSAATTPTKTGTSNATANAAVTTTTKSQSTTSSPSTMPTSETKVASPPPAASSATTSPPSLPQAATSSDQLSLTGVVVLAAAAILVAATTAAYYVKKRRKEDLSEVDARILDYLRKKGGAYETQISRELGIPRTTVFRAVRRLEETGRIRVEKRDGKNWIEPVR
ncbi:MAG: helix-turn-helix domain-containing protein [Pyrobaculum sp.]